MMPAFFYYEREFLEFSALKIRVENVFYAR